MRCAVTTVPYALFVGGNLNRFQKLTKLPNCRSFTTNPELVWVEEQRSTGWACSGCAWQFNPSTFPAGNTLGEIKQNYEWQRDKDFESHVGVEHPKEA